MTVYVPPDLAVAEKVKKEEEESAEQSRRLEHASPEQLRQVLRDVKEPALARGNALRLLLQRKDPELGAILPDLFEDKDMSRMAIRYCPWSDSAAERLRGLLDHADSAVWAPAALALARNKDETIWPRLLSWLEEGDEGRKNVAADCMTKINESLAAESFERAWDNGNGNEKERLVLAASLLRLKDERGLGLLEETAGQARGAWAVVAAACIAHSRPTLAYELMLRIADEGDLEAQRSLVSHAWNMGRIPGAFTAEGLAQARSWVAERLTKTSDR
jgi:hypothetical protein